MPRKIDDPWRREVARALSQNPSLGTREACEMLTKAAIDFPAASVSNLLKNLKKKRQGLKERVEQMADLAPLQLNQHCISEVGDLARRNEELLAEVAQLKGELATERSQRQTVLAQRDALQEKLEEIKKLLGSEDA